MMKLEKLMEVKSDAEGVFLERVTRFTGLVSVGCERFQAHIHNTGRLPILSNGRRVLLKFEGGNNRKTSWDILSVKHEDEWVFVHSGYHRRLAEIFLKRFFPDSPIFAEKVFGRSRLDFVVGENICVEVKGCTYKNGDIAMFPDAPTTRGTKHVEELTKCVKNGMRGFLLFLVFLKSSCFLPNDSIDPDFTRAFWQALKDGVEMKAVRIKYDGVFLYFSGELPLCQKQKTPEERSNDSANQVGNPRDLIR
ncbi:MAG: sugar fermentation stimulation protein [Thermotogota bacterium]|nr:sugar fermentation stimulation protein [Thermotogota bacterium]